MTKGNEMTVRPVAAPVTQENWITIQAIAPVAQASRMFGVTQEQAAIVMLKGHELGLGMATAFEFIHVISDRPSLAPKGALALIHASGMLKRLSIEDLTDAQRNPTACRVMMERNNGFTYTATFTIDDAERAGIVKAGSGWDKYPANMLRWRAIGYCADIVFPDVCGGLMRPDEAGAIVDSEGEPVRIVEAAPSGSISDKVPQPKPMPVPPQVTEEVESRAAPADDDLVGYGSITALLEHWTAEQVMVANEGRIPASAQECIATAKRLLAEVEDA